MNIPFKEWFINSKFRNNSLAPLACFASRSKQSGACKAVICGQSVDLSLRISYCAFALLRPAKLRFALQEQLSAIIYQIYLS